MNDASALVVLHEGAAPDRPRSWFAEQGLEVGPFVGISFAVAGPHDRMRALFPDYDDKRGGGELDLGAVDPDVRAAVRAVAIESPPDFGPGNP